MDPELPYQVADDGKEGDSFNMFPSRADEALKTCKHTAQISQNQVLHVQGMNRLYADIVGTSFKALNPSPVSQWQH